MQVGTGRAVCHYLYRPITYPVKNHITNVHTFTYLLTYYSHCLARRGEDNTFAALRTDSYNYPQKPSLDVASHPTPLITWTKTSVCSRHFKRFIYRQPRPVEYQLHCFPLVHVQNEEAGSRTSL